MQTFDTSEKKHGDFHFQIGRIINQTDSSNMCREICTRTCREMYKIYKDILKIFVRRFPQENGQNKESSLCNREMPHVCNLFLDKLFVATFKIKALHKE